MKQLDRTISNPFQELQNQIQELKNILIETREAMITKNDSDILNINQMADFTGYSKSYLYKMVSTNEIPFVKKGGKLFFSKEQVRQWLFENTNYTEG